MIAPRDIYELADTVEAELLAQEGADLEQVNQILNIFHGLKKCTLHIPTFSKTKYLSSHIGVHIDKLAFGIKDFYFESKFDNSTDHLHSR